jgi:hypothetical protein
LREASKNIDNTYVESERAREREKARERASERAREASKIIDNT